MDVRGSVGTVPVGAEREPGGGPAGPPRRGVLRGLPAAVAALVCAPLATASRPTTADGDGAFDETYRGRRIRGSRVPAADLASAAGPGGAARAGGGAWRVTVDGFPLPLMRRADGSWLSMIDHYRSYPTPQAAARAAVDELGPHRRPRDPNRGRMCGQDRTDREAGRGVHA
ncbi:tyrosinase family oxidase copper chaperone [Streptomyces griseoviridis]